MRKDQGVKVAVGDDYPVNGLQSSQLPNEGIEPLH